MSINHGHKPRHRDDGKYEHKCSTCGVTYRDNHKLSRYCCFAHKQGKSNEKFYQHHKKEIILAVMLRRVRKDKPRRASLAKQIKPKPIDEMSPDELIEFIRKNPGSWRVK